MISTGRRLFFRPLVDLDVLGPYSFLICVSNLLSYPTLLNIVENPTFHLDQRPVVYVDS